eukprot:7924972-Pyramimonas_sp.AAC.1
MLHLTGPGPAKFRRHVFHSLGKVYPVRSMFVGEGVNVVRAAVHLGSVITDRALLGPELVRREAESRVQLSVLSKAFKKATKASI